VLILEDDAVCVPDFASRYAEFAEHLPSDWGMVYLGGQHLMQARKSPVAINSHVVRPFNVNRTHAYMVRGPMMQVVYKHLCDTKTWRNGNHVDHHLGHLHMKMKDPIYAPTNWLVGQAEGKSNVSGKDVPQRFWGRSEVLTVVMGAHRSGSSVLAGVIHRLGLSMGERFVGCEEDGGHEAAWLARLCEQVMPFPSMRLRTTGLASRVQRGLKTHRGQAIKYPHLCAMGDYLPSPFRVVVADRPIEHSIASLVKRSGRRHDHAKLAALQHFLVDQREAFLARWDGPRHRVRYDDLINNAPATVAELANFLGVPAAEAAVSYVKPALNHCGATT
jgi:hypothetical protein